MRKGNDNVSLEITWNTEGVQKKITLQTHKAIKQFLENIVFAAKKECPVRGSYRSYWSAEEAGKKTPGITGGSLRDSIAYKYDSNRIEGMVFTQSGYGGYVEIGTKKMPARPYILPAYETAKSGFFQKLEDMLP